MNIEKLQDLQAIANVLHAVLSVYPEPDLINTFKNQGIAENWPVSMVSDTDPNALELLQRFLDQWSDDDEALINLKLDYGMLFYGPGTPIAAPWGSAYTSSSQLLNDASTMELKQFYVSHNINIDMKSNEPVDHIGLILAVLAYLLNKLIEKPQSSYYQSTINQLLEQHLLPWAYRCLALAYAHAETDYFKGFAILTREYFFHLEEVFELKTKQMAIYR